MSKETATSLAGALITEYGDYEAAYLVLQAHISNGDVIVQYGRTGDGVIAHLKAVGLVQTGYYPTAGFGEYGVPDGNY